MKAQEPGYTFLADLNPGYHKTPSLSSENSLVLETARIQRLSDFCTPYGTLFGNAHMTKTGLCFVWDALELREGVLERTGRSPNAWRWHRDKGPFAFTPFICIILTGL